MADDPKTTGSGPRAAKKTKKAAPEGKPEAAAAEKGEGGVNAEEGVVEPEEKVRKPRRKLTPELVRAMGLRRKKSKHRPYFLRQEGRRYLRLGDTWRRPRGMHSKRRRHWSYRPNVVSIGYRGPRLARGLHPSGYEEVLVHNVREVDGVDPARQAIRIAHSVGVRKRLAIQERATARAKELAEKAAEPDNLEKFRIRILNPTEA